MTRLSKFSVVALVGMLLLVASPVTAQQTMTFGSLPGNNGDLFTGPYAEGGFSLSLLSGQICVAKAFGNPTPDLFGGPVCSSSTSATLSLTRTGGGLFNFLGADLAAQNGNGSWSFAGLLGGGTSYVAAGSIVDGAIWRNTVNPGSGIAVDEVRIALNATGTSFNIDNIRTSVAVPEPGSMMLVATGFFGLVGIRRRREDALSE